MFELKSIFGKNPEKPWCQKKKLRNLSISKRYVMHIMTWGDANQPVLYGMSTTTEWGVREYIQPPKGTQEIYYGLPLRPEYRVFVDFDTNEILGISTYFEPETMKKRFGKAEDSGDLDKVHDYIIYCAMEEELMRQYAKQKDTVIKYLKSMLPNIRLHGQWSVDIIQNGNDFYLIDMALSVNSALNGCVPAGKLKAVEEDWLPRIGKWQEKTEKRSELTDLS